MFTKIKRQDCLNKYPSFPLRNYDVEKDEEIISYPKVFRSYILTLHSKSFRGHVKQLGEELLNMAKYLDYEKLIFMGDDEIAWLHQQNDYRPVKEAQEYLIENKVGKHFNGAISVDNTELTRFVKHLSWMTRCNAALPFIYFSDNDHGLIGNICKYGNLHLDILNQKTDKLFQSFIDKCRFVYLDAASCYNRFGKSNAIAGRTTIV